MVCESLIVSDGIGFVVIKFCLFYRINSFILACLGGKFTVFSFLIILVTEGYLKAWLKYDYLGGFIFRFHSRAFFDSMLCRQEVKVVLAHDLKDLDVWIIFHSKEIGFLCEGFSGCSLLVVYSYGLIVVVSWLSFVSTITILEILVKIKYLIWSIMK